MTFLAYNFDWSIVTDRWRLFVAGAWVDLWVAVIGFALACAIGLVNALLRTSGLPFLSIPSFIYVQVMRGVPLYVLLLWVYFGVANLASIDVNRASPSVFSRSAISTVTPLIIRMTDHGILLIASR